MCVCTTPELENHGPINHGLETAF